ncbi:MAG: VOC family protein [Anaerolineae bacterium]|nr:VOC family protein [Anaerolineae bacterium]
MTELTHTRLLVKDFPACFRFYRDIMGFKVVWGEEDGVYAEFNAGGINLALFARPLMAAAVGGAEKPAHAEMQDSFVLVFEVENVNEYYREMQVSKVDFINMPQDKPEWGVRVVHLRDPDGNLIEINQPLED